jgi:predicted helicase
VNPYLVDLLGFAPKEFMVVLGNPPYSGASANKGKWARELVQRYYQVDGAPLGEKNPKWLQDDYVKFLAFGQWRIEQTGSGVLGFITNHSYLDNPTFRGMRQSLMNTFTDIYIFNLHGNSKKKEVSPDGGKDENVFDIQQGVTIGIFIKEIGKTSPATIHYADLWGKREGKYLVLAETDISLTKWIELEPTSPYYLLVPQDTNLLPEYQNGWKVTDIFPVNVLGFQTHRDEFAIDFEEKEVRSRIINLRDSTYSDEELIDLYGLRDNNNWQLSIVRKQLKDDIKWEQYFTQCLYRPFDLRYCYFNKTIIDRPRRQLIHNVFQRNNLCILLPRQIAIDNWGHVGISNLVAESCAISTNTTEQNYIFPLYLYPAEGEMQLGGKRQPNLNSEFIKAFSGKLGMKFIEDGKGNLLETFGPEDIFDYAYAIFHSPAYRSRYAEFLKIDFPRLPLTSDKVLFRSLVEKGGVLVSLHLMESPLLNNIITKYEVKGEHLVEKVSYDEKTLRVSINKTQYFEGVPPAVWNFHIGGYQVCEKWLKDRKGRKLTIDDIAYYQKIVVALKETIRLMQEIDAAIAEHGGWPVAFD